MCVSVCVVVLQICMAVTSFSNLFGVVCVSYLVLGRTIIPHVCLGRTEFRVLTGGGVLFQMTAS